ncbi:MAG: sulfotransferase domain-containing protein [Deltaproteobacteria bacterium]|nr:sulfotransferase domain-containing protein [Deltaproteobacteria bacterium]
MDSNQLQDIYQGEQLFQEGKIEEALVIFENVLEKNPDNLSALNNKGVALNELKRYHEAIDMFQAVLKKDSDNANAAFNLISNYFATDNWREAENALMGYGHCLAQDDINLIKNDLAKFQSITKPHVPGETPQNSPFVYENAQEDVNRIIHSDLFFIMGTPKSGTTWLQYLLNGHPEILCSGEGNFNQLIKGLNKVVNDYNTYIEEINKAIGTSNYTVFSKENLQYLFVTIVGLLFSNIKMSPSIKCIGSKNPILIKELEIHASLLPRSKFIHIIRDGRDVIASAWFNNRRRNKADSKKRWPDFKSFVQFGVEQWVSDVRKARSFGRLFPDRYFELRYEDLHKNPDPIIEKMLNFLKVNSTPELAERCRWAGSFEKLSKGRKRGEEDENTFFRKGIIGDWEQHFDKESVDIFMLNGQSLLKELGYS